MIHNKKREPSADRLRLEPAMLSTTDAAARAALDRLLGDRRVLASLPDVVCAIARDYRLLYLNRTVSSQNAPELVGSNVLDHLPDPDRSRYRDAFELAWSTNEPQTIEVSSLSGAFWDIRLVPVTENGEVVLMLATSRDITDRRRAEEALSQSESRLRLALAAGGMGTWTWNADTNTIHCDDTLCAILGVSPEDAPTDAQSTLALIHPDDRVRASEQLRRLNENGNLKEWEYRVVRPDGEIRYLLGRGLAVHDHTGKLLGTRGIAVDLTERKRLEDQLRHAQKMDAIGQLTAGIAHNFNNVLGIILPNVALCEANADEQTRERLADIRHAAEHAADLVRQLMLFARRETLAQKAPTDLAQVAGRLIQMCRTTFGGRFTITFQAEPELPKVLANAGQIEQALLNICLNARDALLRGRPSRPTITVRVERIEPDRVRLSVTDNGPGMDEATRARVFEPFFTTKGMGRGTGLGLASVYAIVNEHGGKVTCTSALGEGATFTIDLPALPASSRVAPQGDTRAGECVLIIDDEAAARRVVRAVLEGAGYTVLEASDGDEGLAIYQRDAARIAAILLDRTMPRMSGEQVLDALHALGSSTSVILLSGDPGACAARTDIAAVLAKPANADEILDTLRDVLARSPRAETRSVPE